MNENRRGPISIPNIITCFRLLLIPLFVLAFFEGSYIWSIVCLALSGVSDVADGYIARHCDMVTDLGKLLDPVADKLTQGAVLVCLAFRDPILWILFGLLAFKELVMSVWGWIGLRRTGRMVSARWYGKVCTALLYASMAALVLVPGMPAIVTRVIVGVCGGMIVLTVLCYSGWYLLYLRENRTQEVRRVREHGSASANVSVVLSAMILVLLLICAAVALIYRREISTESIAGFLPKNLWLAALVFMALFAAKSLTSVVNVKILYTASAVVFPLPAALAVNLAGTAVELIVPYFIGRSCGSRTAELAVERWPRLRRLRRIRSRSDFWFSLLARATGVLPTDPVSICFGACRMPFGAFLRGGMLGLLPMLLIATFFGRAAGAPGSPGFTAAVILFAAVQAAAIAAFILWLRYQSRAVSQAEKEGDKGESAQ